MGAAAIARNYKDTGFDVLLHHGIPRTSLDELTRHHAPVPTRTLPPDLDFYRADSKAAHEPRWRRGGRLGRTPNARRRGAVEIAMISLTQDGGLRGSGPAALAWADVKRVRGVPGLLRVQSVEEDSHRVASADTMKLLLPIHRGAG